MQRYRLSFDTLVYGMQPDHALSKDVLLGRNREYAEKRVLWVIHRQIIEKTEKTTLYTEVVSLHTHARRLLGEATV